MAIESTHKLRRLGILCFVLVMILYGLFQARNLLMGPVVLINTPKNGAMSAEALTTITGEARNISEITLNDRPILVDEEGYFEEQLLLPQGYTIMTLEARDRFGRTTVETLQLVRL